MKRSIAAIAVALLCLAACHRPETPATGAAEPVSGSGSEQSPPVSAWDAMNREQRMDLMKHKVLPNMKAAFTAWEADEFGSMNCVTCHGAGAKDKTFKMPNPGLPKLPTDEAGFRKLAAEEPEALQFMKEVVVPEMASMLGEKPFDPATHTGFGCFECHTAEK